MRKFPQCISATARERFYSDFCLLTPVFLSLVSE
jgi:hypothetical protein